MSTYDRNYYLKNKNIINERALTKYWNNREEEKAKRRAYTRRVREEALAFYGGMCACCQETRYEFLTFDHIKNDGAEHRRKDKLALKTHQWLRKNNYPKDFQILCWNCNASKGLYGKCPHQ